MPHLKCDSKRSPQAESRNLSFALPRNRICEGHTFRTMLNTHPSSWTERYSAVVGGAIFDYTEHGLRFQPPAIDEAGGRKVAGRE